jgi:predicted O-methyltransferase YrrM
MADVSANRGPRIVDVFVPVMQRRRLNIDASILALVEPLFLIQTHMSFEERLLLLRVALALPNSFLGCEVGSYLGASSSFLAAAASLKGGHLHCIDTWQSDAMAVEPPEDTFARFLENTHRFRHFISPHRGIAAEISRSMAERFDILFIDADHSYEGVKSDLDCYVPKLKHGGILAMHDFHNHSAVSQAVFDYFGGVLPPQRGTVQSLQIFQVMNRD